MKENAILSKNGKKGALATAGIDMTNEQSGLAIRFITAASNVYEAMSQTVFRDHKHLADTTALFSWCVRNLQETALEDLLVYLNGLPSVGGYSRAQAVMIGTGLIAPEALGVMISAASMKFIKEQIEARSKGQRPTEETEKSE
jgi:hypothetical protein